MFEKELEEYKNQPKWKGKIFMKDEEICFKDGMKLGYNKANEWHYMKDGIMPKENQEVLVYFTLPDKSKNDIMMAQFENNDFNFVDLQDVIAWKEIIPPKEQK